MFYLWLMLFLIFCDATYFALQTLDDERKYFDLFTEDQLKGALRVQLLHVDSCKARKAYLRAEEAWYKWGGSKG